MSNAAEEVKQIIELKHNKTCVCLCVWLCVWFSNIKEHSDYITCTQIFHYFSKCDNVLNFIRVM